MPGAKWFPDASLNFAENLLRFSDDQPALASWNEQGHQRTLTFKELREAVGTLALALSASGVQAGDRVPEVGGDRLVHRLAVGTRVADDREVARLEGPAEAAVGRSGV